MRPSKKDLLGRAKSLMNPLRKLTVDGRARRNPINQPEKVEAVRRYSTGPRPAWVGHSIPIPKPGPKLVTEPHKVKKLTHGDFVCEITVNRKSNPMLFHYVVTRKDSPEILEWGQTISVHAAIARAKASLKRGMMKVTCRARWLPRINRKINRKRGQHSALNRVPFTGRAYPSWSSEHSCKVGWVRRSTWPSLFVQ
jgi:hypothetical protein